MLDARILCELKQVNVSTDYEKTKERVKRLWAEAPSGTREQVLKQAANAESTVLRVFRKGSIMPKLALAMSEVLNVDPFYLTGDVDENQGWHEGLLADFLMKKNYSSLLRFIEDERATISEPMESHTAKSKASDADEHGVTPVFAPPPAETKDVSLHSYFDESTAELKADANRTEQGKVVNLNTEFNWKLFSDEDYITILRGLLLKARFGNEAAADQMSTIAKILIQS